MKFAKQLHDQAVPEWRTQYLDYKLGKKKVKAVAKALRNVPDRPKPNTPGSSLLDGPVLSLLRPRNVRTSSDSQALTQPGPPHEESPLQTRQQIPQRPRNQRMTSYGSIIGSPPNETALPTQRKKLSPSLELPAPAVPVRRTLSTSEPAVQRANIANIEDIPLETYKDIDFRKADFFLFLDRELNKVESFYKTHEDQAIARLAELRQQLHRLRESRAREVAKANVIPEHHGDPVKENKVMPHQASSALSWLVHTVQRHLPGHVGKTSRAMSQLGTPTLDARTRIDWPEEPDGNRDYVRRHKEEISYRTAKKQLKLACQGYYQDIERIKSYALLNRTAFRKIVKKYTKRTGLTTSYMDTHIDQAHFVKSEDIESLLNDTEDLYSRYFERGNKKIAINKLRAGSEGKKVDCSGSISRASALFGIGAVLAIEGTVDGVKGLWTTANTLRLKLDAAGVLSTLNTESNAYDPVITSYLLQLYAGYFMILLLAFLFVACLWWFKQQKVNYVFIFELNKRNVMDWRQLVELPTWYWFGLGLTMYFNFSWNLGGSDMYVYWPVVLVGLSVLSLFLPVPIFFYRQRLWLASALSRLLISSTIIFTPDVEFRDLFIGDMFCSLTYATGNVALFFCLYANLWWNPGQCNSSHFWLLGFFSALPGYWRLSQCLKRYWVSREWFPNLANAGKYTATIMQYVTLAMYRMNKQSWAYFAAFIACASINTVYCTIWDLVMDWSLTDAEYRYLRRTLVFTKHKWLYYAAMAIDPVLRANWIFYAIFTHDAQHSTIVSFSVATSEILRRGIWVLFRVENEQAKNQQSLTANRVLPLPYDLPDGMDGLGAGPGPQTFLQRVGSEMRSAHTRDYARRTPRDEAFAQDDEDDDEDSDDGD